MSIVLQHQLEASEKSAEQLGREIQQQHRQATICCDVQDLMRMLVQIFNDLNRHVEQWQAGIEHGGDERDGDAMVAARDFEALYHRLDTTCTKTGALMYAAEQWGF